MAFSASQRVLLAVIAVLFAIGTSVLSWDNARSDLASRFHWPDEATNAFFASRVARGASLAIPESRNGAAGNLIHPRTANVRGDGSIVPGAYLGLPLWYGIVGRVLGERAMLFITPILAALGLLAFARILRVVVSARVALLATVILALHPSVWLFTATTFLPNVPFVALLLLGFAVFARADSRQPTADRTAPTSHCSLLTAHCSSGLILGLALTFRTHEVLWVGALVTGIVWFQVATETRNGQWSAIGPDAPVGTGYRLSAIGFGLALPFLPILILQNALYGSPFTTGYALLHEGGAAPTEFATSFLPAWAAALTAPFGWHPVRAAVNAWQYLIAPHAWFAVLAALGMVVGRRHRVALAWTLGITVWLLLAAGSWELADPLVRTTNVLTISYVRYWLPIIVLLAPWAALGVEGIMRRMDARVRPAVLALLLIGVALTATARTVLDPREGLFRQRTALAEHRVRARAVIAATEPNAVIVSHRMDKVFFPERAVIHASDVERTDAVFQRDLRALVARAPVYWYAPGAVSLPGFTLTSVPGAPFGERLVRVE